MKDSRNISAMQVFFLITLLMNGTYSLLLPQSIGRFITQADGALVILASAVVGLVVLQLVKGIAQSQPQKGIVSYLPELLGRFWGKVIGLVFCLYFLFLTVFYLACFHEMLSAELLPNTPRWLVLTATLLLIGWIVHNGLEDIARFSTLLAPFVLIMLILVLLGNYQDIHWINVLPFGSSDWWERFHSFKVTLPLFLNVLCLLVLYPRVLEKKQIWKIACLSVLVSGIYLAVMFLAVLGTFGATEGVRIVWPLIEMSRMVRIGPFLERIEAVFIASWLSIVFLNGSVLAYCTAQCIRQWRQSQSRSWSRWCNGLTMALIWISVLWVDDMVRMFLQQWVISNVLIWVMLVLLIIIRLAVFWKQRKEAPHVKV